MATHNRSVADDDNDQRAANTAKKTLSAINRIFSSSVSAPIAASKTSFRPSPTPAKAATGSSSNVTQDPSSISGLKFCLHMVFFAAPGIILAKRLADGERVEDMAEKAKATFDNLVNIQT
ncbi:hypothetical protein FBU30_001380 [Linnemannia zychae]|nr:hypothetical protein FBU30_001380 [Linnemannia zychae]